MIKHTPSFSTHLEQYVYACNYVYKKSVLDIGCGEGYGPQILSYGASTLDMADVSDRALAFAKSKNYYCPVNFYKIDLEHEFVDGKWDVIVALQVLEHIQNVDNVVNYCFNSLNEGGMLVYGIPHMMPADDHKRLYNAKDVINLFSMFNNVDIFVHDKKIISREPHYKGRKSYVGIAYK